MIAPDDREAPFLSVPSPKGKGKAAALDEHDGSSSRTHSPRSEGRATSSDDHDEASSSNFNSRDRGTAVPSGASSDTDRTHIEAWTQQNLLSLDGGGIRGYWTLLVLKRLMEEVADKERELADGDGRKYEDHFHSFWPQEYPKDVSRGWDTPQEKEKLAQARKENRSEAAAREDARKFLPCHYFDYICGTSTGALIAIMLGRFRMTVRDCMDEYKKMGDEIFGNPRPIYRRRALVVPWTKYKSSAMENAVMDVTARRCEVLEGFNPVTLDSIPGLCKTLVLSFRTERGEGGAIAKHPHLFRSYDNIDRADPFRVARVRTVMSEDLIRAVVRNKGPADRLPIWQVARAATAAPLYFSEIKLKKRMNNDEKKLTFSDAGFGITNNPCEEGVDEIESLHGKASTGSIGIIVTIGTARGPTEPGGNSLLGIVKEAVANATDPEAVHRKLHDRYPKEGSPVNYYRFNDSNGINIELDDWKPKRSRFSGTTPGHATLNAITQGFNSWVAKPENVTELQRCAKHLVERRRNRTRNAGRWERYATGAKFYCRHTACGEVPFNYRDDFNQHVLQQHENRAEFLEPITTRWLYQEDTGKG